MLLLATLAMVMETKEIIRAQEGATTTGKFIIKLSRDTSTERFNDLVDYVERESEDSQIYRKVNGNFTKIITARLSEAALEMVSCENGQCHYLHLRRQRVRYFVCLFVCLCVCVYYHKLLFKLNI